MPQKVQQTIFWFLVEARLVSFSDTRTLSVEELSTMQSWLIIRKRYSSIFTVK